jgi:hypothetical protein
MLYGDHDLVAEGCVTPARATKDADAEHLLGTAVVSDRESGFLLYHLLNCFLGC